MRIWLEKCEEDYFIHLTDPEWYENIEGWLSAGGDLGIRVDGKKIEEILPRAHKMDVHDLAEIELVNCIMWEPDHEV